MLGKKTSYWDEKGCLETVRALCQQPASWKRTQKQVRDQKDALKAFMEPALARPDLTIAFCGLQGVLAKTLFDWADTDVKYETRWLAEGETLSDQKNMVLVSIETEENTMELAEIIDRQPVSVLHVIVTGNSKSPLVHAAQGLTNMYGLVVKDAGLTSLILAAFMTLHLEILDDLQLDDMIHSATQVLNQNAPVLEDFAASHTYPALRAVGFNIRQKRHGMKEMTGVMKASFISPYTGLPYDGEPLNLLYLPDDPSLKKEQVELTRVLRREGQLVLAVEARHEEAIRADGTLDLKLLMARHNVYAAFAFLTVFDAMVVFTAAKHNIALDDGPRDIRMSLDSWMEKAKLEDVIDA